MHYDEYERHKFCETFLVPNCKDKVLDVGGTKLMNKFLPDSVVTSLNIDNTGDIQYEGETFPFPDQSFNAVVSLDTLEHIQRDERSEFLQECLRVAKNCIIVAAPYGTKGHNRSEIFLLQMLRQVNHPNRWLEEHVKNGLPSSSEISTYVELFQKEGYLTKVFFAGDYVWQCRNMEFAIRLERLRIPYRLANLISFLAGLSIWHQVKFSKHPLNTTNRFYIFGRREVSLGS